MKTTLRLLPFAALLLLFWIPVAPGEEVAVVDQDAAAPAVPETAPAVPETAPASLETTEESTVEPLTLSLEESLRVEAAVCTPPEGPLPCAGCCLKVDQCCSCSCSAQGVCRNVFGTLTCLCICPD